MLYIDGGMNFNPYGIAKYARECEIDHREALEHMHISRVFTLFQLNTILQERLEQKIIGYSPKILIIGKFLTPYLDSEVAPHQVNIIMKNNLKKIREIAEKYGLIVILSNSESGMKFGEKFKRILYGNVDEIITIRKVGKVVTFNSTNVLIKLSEQTVSYKSSRSISSTGLSLPSLPSFSSSGPSNSNPQSSFSSSTSASSTPARRRRFTS